MCLTNITQRNTFSSTKRTLLHGLKIERPEGTGTFNWKLNASSPLQYQWFYYRQQNEYRPRCSRETRRDTEERKENCKKE